MAHRKVLLTALAVIASAGALAACSVDKEADAAARKFNDELRAGTTGSDPAVGPQLQTPDAQNLIAAFHAQSPTDAPTAVTNTGFNFNSENGNTQMQLTYKYDFSGGRTMVIDDVLQKNSGQTTWQVVGFKLEPGATAMTGPQGGSTNAPQDAAGAPPPPSGGDASGGAPASNASGN